jgi:hypothetical protein
LVEAVVAHWREQWRLIGGSSGGSLVRAVVTQWWEPWWLIDGSSGGSLMGPVVAHWKRHKIVIMQSWVQIQQSPLPTVDC